MVEKRTRRKITLNCLLIAFLSNWREKKMEKISEKKNSFLLSK